MNRMVRSVLLLLTLTSMPAGFATAQEAPGALPPEGSTIPSVDQTLADYSAVIGEYVAVQTGFGLEPGDGLDPVALQLALARLLGESLDELAEITGSANTPYSCLVNITGSPPLAAYLAAIAQRKGDPAFLTEYISTFCTARVGDPYEKGKIPMLQAKVTDRRGDLVVDKKKIWLEVDQGSVGHRNGHVDEREWFQIKLGVTNRSTTTPYLSTSASLVLLDEKGNPCPLPYPDAALPAARPPEICTAALVLSERVSVPELSPGEQATVGPFRVALHPQRKGPFTLTFGLDVQSSSGGAANTRLEVPVSALPSLELSALTVDDDSTGQSKGNGDGRVEPGETVELRGHLTLDRRSNLSKLAIDARQFTTFLEAAPRRMGIANLRKGRATQIAGDVEFALPTVDEMAALPTEELDPRFFQRRQLRFWLAASGCAGRLKLDRDWPRNVPARVTCPYSSPGYQFVLPIDVDIEFGQLFAITTTPPGATIVVNGIGAGRTEESLPLIFPQVKPVKNTIVYYDVEASYPGHVTQATRVPVIWKERTAENLTTHLHFDLAAIPAPPPPPPPPTLRKRKKVVRAKPVRPEQPVASFRRHFSLFAGGLLRFYKPHYSRKVLDADRINTPAPTAGFEVGGRYFFARNFYLSTQAQLHFTVGDPAARFYAPAAETQGTNAPIADVRADQLTGLGFVVEPRFRLEWWHLLFNLGMGLQLDSTFGDVRQTSYAPGADGATVAASVQPAALHAAARLSADIGVDTDSPFQPYVGSFFILPANGGLDWGLALGVEMHL